MASSFGGINTALTSLYAQRRGLDVAGQNIANANTEGYTRQRVDMQAQVGATKAAMYAKTDGLGTGVAVSNVQRLRDEFLENRGRTEHGVNAHVTSQRASYVAIEDAFAEPSDTGIAAQLHNMWGSWNDVANNPQLTAPRSALLQQSATVANQLNAADESLSRQWSQNRTQVSGYIDEVNGTARSLAQLNDSIIKANASQVPVNELEDQRDMLAMKLAELTGASASKRENGGMDVFIGNSYLVSGATAREVGIVGAESLTQQKQGGVPGPVALVWMEAGQPTTQPVQAGGTMGALMDTMTSIIPDRSIELDGVADALISMVNTEHAQGFDVDGNACGAFFGRRGDGSIEVLITDPDAVAISATQGALDNSVADKIAGIAEEANGPDRKYQAMIGELGVLSQGTARRAEIQSFVTEQVDAAREGESGVNLDEEMTNLLTYQRGYEAASRVLTTIDSMLDQLINRTGLVGR